MKLKKYLLAIAIISICTSYSHADSDITDMIFADNKQDDIIFANTINTTQIKTQQIDTKIKQDVDIFVQKAIEKAKAEEEKKRQEKIKQEQEKKEQEELRKKQEERKLQEQKKQEDEKKALEEEGKKDTQVSKNFITSDVTEYAKTLLGIPYVWGGASISGFDCSGFVQFVYNKFDIKLKRTTYDQIKQGMSVELENIKENDLVFFDTRAAYKLAKKNNDTSITTLSEVIINENEKNIKVLYPTEPTHVGIYIGDGKIIHASSSKKQTVIDILDNGYFKERIVDIRRYK